MTVNNVIARMYDAGVSKVPDDSSSQTAVDNGEFQKAVEEKVNSCNGCCDCEARAVSAKTDTEAVKTVENDSDEERSVMYRFTAYVRISSDFAGLGSNLLEEFKAATKSFISAVKADSSSDIPVLDQYLSQAEKSAGEGVSSGKSFIDSILAAADNGLKAITASMAGSAWMSGLNMTGSSGLTSASPIDIARIHLQNSLNSVSSGSSTADILTADYGNGRQLELVNSRSVSLEKVDADAGQSNKVNDAAVLSRRDKFFDRFLQLIDRMDSAFSGLSIIRAGFSIALEDLPEKTGTDAGKAVGIKVVEDSASGEGSEEAVSTVSETEEVIA